MNTLKFENLQKEFLSIYPGGFSNPELLELGKKHQASQRIKQAHEFFSEDNFASPTDVVKNMIKTVSRSSLVSRYEKPRLKNWINSMTIQEQESYAFSLRDILHGDQEYGFNIMMSLLEPGKLAKWPLMTILPYYYAPLEEVFVKPTTTKKIIQYLELESLVYNPRPSFEFYTKYRKQINHMRKAADSTLQMDNAAFCGFLMMSIR